MEMNQYVREYKKKSRRAMRRYYAMAVLNVIICLIIWLYLAAFNVAYVYLLIPFVCGLFFSVIILRNAHRRNIDTINKLLTNNLDVHLVVECYEQLMYAKKGKEFAFVYVNYLKTLLLLGEYDKFIEVYKSYPKYSKKINIQSLKLLALSLKEDRTEYRELLFAHKFSKYRKTNEKLSDQKEQLKVLDQNYEISQLYELKEYRKAIEKIESIKFYNPYNILLFESYKQRCLYHLNEKYSFPNENVYPFSFVAKWKYLIETGEEYSYERVDELLDIFEQNEKSIKNTKKKICIMVAAYLVVLAFLLAKLTPAKKTTIEEYKMNLSAWDYEVTRIYGLCSNKDLSGGIMYGARDLMDGESEPDYYFTSINYFRDGLIPKMQLHIEPLIYSGGTEVFVADGEDSSYVTVITDELLLVTYDKKAIDTVNDRLFLDSYETGAYFYSFIVEGKFNINYLGIDGKTLSENGEFIEAETVDPEEIKKGIKMFATAQNEDGLVLVCSYRGNISNVQTGARYWLEEMTPDGWKIIEIEDDEDRWKTHKYYLEEGQSTIIEINWGNVYYKVPAGQYRIGKEFTWTDNESGRVNTFPEYAEFEIK